MKSLLVEDNRADARLVREMLKESAGGTFQLQEVGQLGLALERCRQEKFDVVLLDLGLPDSQGLESLLRIQEASGGVPIVVLTGLDDEAFAVEAVRAGAQDFLVKGRFDSRLLIRTMHYAIERKRVDEEVHRLNEELARRVVEVQQLVDQLRALAAELSQTEQRERRRLAAVLHDHIQQLLVAAKMQLALIKRADMTTIQSTAQGIESIINDAIEASRSLTVELSPPILHQAGLASCLNWLANRMEEKSLFKVNVRANNNAEPAEEAVRLLLFESVRELLLNAVKYSGEKEAHVTMWRDKGGWTKIIVEDKGNGFDAETVKSRKSGGFGLFSIQQRLVYFGGKMEVESAPGKGTRVILSAPPGPPVTAPGSAATATASGGQEAVQFLKKDKKITVLLVDDHKIVRQGLVSLLQFEPDMEVIGEAGNGAEAVEMARKLKPDVVIMDINMPIMSGVEATQVLMKEMPHLRIIGLSMHTDKDVSAAMHKAGAVGYLTKRGRSGELIEAIRACAGQPAAAHAGARPGG